MLSQTLAGLRDVDEVQGSFLLGSGGHLLARDLPAVFHAEIFADVGPRLVRLRDTFDEQGGSTTLTMRFTDHKLHVRAIGSKLLCVLTGAGVNGPALRMAMNLVARHVETHPEQDDGAAEIPRQSVPATTTPPPEREPEYRGRLR
jgi:predicted regulator of Ras-like GTPase activity (Roadblock/LC7/MglB family)